MKNKIQPSDITLLIFGGKDDNGVTLRNSFEGALSYNYNVKVWADTGIKPFDCNCLQGKVKHEVITLPDGTITVDATSLLEKLLHTEDLNKKATYLLIMNGLDEIMFLKNVPRLYLTTKKTVVAAPYSYEIKTC